MDAVLAVTGRRKCAGALPALAIAPLTALVLSACAVAQPSAAPGRVQATATAVTIAVATVGLSGCDAVGLTIGGRRQPALAGPGTDTGPRILKAAGLAWRIPTD